MLTVNELLKTQDVRISCGNRWLVYDDIVSEYVVYEHKYGARNTTEIIRGSEESEACEALIEGE